MSRPACAALAARKSATRCSPARGPSAGAKAGLTLGSATSSPSNFSVFVTSLSGASPRGTSAEANGQAQKRRVETSADAVREHSARFTGPFFAGSSVRRDRYDKKELYARFGVK